MSQLIDDLTNTRSFVERGWTQHTLSVDADGRTADPSSPEAKKWCLDGALYAAVPDLSGNNFQDKLARRHQAREAITQATDDLDSIDQWNDKRGRTQEQVLAALDQTVAYCEEHDL